MTFASDFVARLAGRPARTIRLEAADAPAFLARLRREGRPFITARRRSEGLYRHDSGRAVVDEVFESRDVDRGGWLGRELVDQEDVAAEVAEVGALAGAEVWLATTHPAALPQAAAVPAVAARPVESPSGFYVAGRALPWNTLSSVPVEIGGGETAIESVCPGAFGDGGECGLSVDHDLGMRWQRPITAQYRSMPDGLFFAARLGDDAWSRVILTLIRAGQVVGVSVGLSAKRHRRETVKTVGGGWHSALVEAALLDVSLITRGNDLRPAYRGTSASLVPAQP
jgi:hypothetical protein